MITDENIKRIEEYCKERNEMLMKRDVDALIAFLTKYNPHYKFSSRKIAEMTLHKTITAIPSLPLEMRLKSKRWLNRRNYHSFDDGELKVILKKEQS